ncbi:DUF5103 domain-containing protein [Apibacter muscae]|uniref:DUF5103 domain-containing protein n=1 Tax=Apibacter muscae TaxID=2509004 RepID=A0A563DGF2_9FLAO|nr:type IX secretion system plug protein domain-containing protein [Apibacter muscae]TWP29318.1 DUF5103 domain-containing protein [Apibacter muscae]
MIKYSIILFLIAQWCFAQNAVEKIYNPSVNGIQIFNYQTNDETPFFKMGDTFQLSFDMLDQNYQTLYYSIKHFDRNWEDDNLFESEYIVGYPMSQIYNYKSSFNTQQNYTHYSIEFPNNDMQPKISGNYLITVYDQNQKPIFSKKIAFYETQVTVGVNYERYISSSNQEYNQRVMAEVLVNNTSNIMVNQFSLTLLQNNNWNTAITNIKPQFTSANTFTFTQLDNTFIGGNQFYSFDTKNISVPGYGVYQVNRQANFYETLLYPVIPYPTDYVYKPDVYGAYYFRRFDLNQERNATYEGDYTPVTFSVNLTNPLENKDLYVVGMFNNYQLTDSNKMEYDEEEGYYAKTILLKQGYYNYTIATVDRNTQKMDLGEIPGSFWQTMNLYQGLAYYTPFGGTYDALIGYGELRMTQ